ncbi:MAG: FxsA family protein [Halothiobacillaceae bacterium]|nr:FxsA family protein [Halothiobacillaceae bacterium]
MRVGVILALLVLPLAELYVLIALGARIGALWMILWVVASAVLGVIVWRRQGAQIMLSAMREASRGRAPTTSPFETLLVGFAGILLIFPGVITDVLALPLLIPPLRRALLRSWLARLMRAMPTSAAGGRVIEGESQRLDDR